MKKVGGGVRVELNSTQLTLLHIETDLTTTNHACSGTTELAGVDLDKTYFNESYEAEPVPEFEFDQAVSW